MAPSPSPSAGTASAKYVKKSHIEHILDRPDTYIGSTDPVEDAIYVLNEAKDAMELRNLTFTPGLFKIFDEILNNAYDQSVVDPTLDTIKVSIDACSGVITVANNGKGIPVQRHDEHGVHIPEMIFGHLLTSSNYDDSQERMVGGRNGYGAKLTNIFSKEFCLDIVDGDTGAHYAQAFRDNLSVIGKPSVRASRASNPPKGHVKIAFAPDYARFGMPGGLGEAMLALFERRVYDVAACVHAGVSVFWQGKKVATVKSFERYVDMFLGDRKVPRVFQRLSDRWEVAIAYSDAGFRHWSFVNGIATYKGGSHVNYVTQQLVEKMKASSKKAAGVRPGDIRERLWVFIKCTLVNPAFSSQTKEECASKVASWGSRVELPDDLVKRVVKLGILDNAIEESVSRDMAKSDGRKRSTLKVPKLEDANKAGTAESHLCTLILTEGDSAKTFAISGMQVTGRDHWGVFPLKGKLLNVRDASSKQVVDNVEISNLKQILGLQHGKEYLDTCTLRYGKVMVLADSDVDGLHIKGLVLNLFHCYWPSLIKGGFVVTMATPIVKAFPLGKRPGLPVQSFFTLQAYNAWKGEQQLQGLAAYRIKYYKGLGTSTSTEAKEIFAGWRDKTLTYAADRLDDTNAAMELAFRKTLTHQRKAWIQGTLADEAGGELPNAGRVEVSDFINTQLVQFSIADVVRSLPSMVDGLKPSQRKVVFACLKRNIHAEMKVSQLASAVGEMTSYHHGDASLCATVINMAQNFVGSNNLNLLKPVGQFGTRLQGGKDAASPRYIFSQLEGFTKKIFDARDSSLLEYLDDDGTPIEPKYFVPIVPMVLINGAEGIGTGYSTSVPAHKPADVIDNIRRFLEGAPMVPLTPWYRGFKGTIRALDEASFQVEGVAAPAGARGVDVTELPVGCWTSDFKEYLESDRCPADSYKNYSTDTTVHFNVSLAADKAEAVRQDPIKHLGLSKVIHTSNMHLFDASGKIKKYGSTVDILTDFCELRLAVYERRRMHLIAELEGALQTLSDKMRFIRLVIDDELVVFRRKQDDIFADMARVQLPTDLIKTPVSDFTQDKLDALQQRIDAVLADKRFLEAATASKLWVMDLEALSAELSPSADGEAANEAGDAVELSTDSGGATDMRPLVSRRRRVAAAGSK